jgi:protease-4
LKKVEEQLQAFYDQFVEKVAKARRTTPEKIDQIAQGRVWTGRQAKDKGLVDELGGLAQAIASAKKRAKIAPDTEVELVPYPPRRSFYELVSEQFSGNSERAAIGRWVSANLSAAELDALRTLRGPFAIFRRGEPLALMPVTFLR